MTAFPKDKSNLEWSTNFSVRKIFSRDTNVVSQWHQILNIFRHSGPIMRGVHM